MTETDWQAQAEPVA